jgi:hypothetical protein
MMDSEERMYDVSYHHDAGVICREVVRRRNDCRIYHDQAYYIQLQTWADE